MSKNVHVDSCHHLDPEHFIRILQHMMGEAMGRFSQVAAFFRVT